MQVKLPVSFKKNVGLFGSSIPSNSRDAECKNKKEEEQEMDGVQFYSRDCTSLFSEC